jgi:hypothetical protein
MVSFPTHMKGNMLDFIITNCPEKVLTVSDGGRLGKSDHCIILAEVECDIRRRVKVQKTLNWSRANFEGMRRELEAVDWKEVIRAGTVNDAWSALKERLQAATMANVPEGKRGPWMRNPWMTREIIRLLRQKRRRWKAMKATGSAEAGRLYKEAEKECANKIRSAKRKMERDLANNPDKNNRKFARYIKSKTKSRTTIGPLKAEDGRLLTDDTEMAEELNRFFSSVFTRESLDNIPEPIREDDTMMRKVHITSAQVKRQIDQLRADSAPGPDGISPRVLKELRDVMAWPFALLFNRSLTEGKVPCDWRTGIVTPIYKKGPKGNSGNYRPVSLTSVPCKLMESILKCNIMEHLMCNNLIRPS